MKKIKIPIGRSGFADIRKNGYYYIDKSGLIEELLKTDATMVTLITRPRRFGKTLGMRMLSEFFDIRKDSRELFEGLSIMEKKELCEHWMNQYPTVFLSFRMVDGLEFKKAYAKLCSILAELYREHFYFMESEKINDLDKEVFYRIAAKKASQEELENSLFYLIKIMSIQYEKPVILLLDEYDVPLAKASEHGYYTEMLDVMKNMMQAIKDNDNLKFAVITGCLRIAKESIFTGTNNFVSDTISDTRLNEYFGFTQNEIDRLLQETKLIDHKQEIKEWYNGYHFGSFDIYCPWDVMNHINNLLLNPLLKPKSFWENTSDNAIIRSFFDREEFDINDKFELLLSGGYIKEEIKENLTYDVLNSSEDNLWSLLYFTGYLTKVKEECSSLLQGQFALKIPNKEIMGIFKNSVKVWFIERTATSNREELFTALWNLDDKKLTSLISDLLFDTISYHDYRESFYHAFLTGLVSSAGYQVESNYENGLGRSDLVIKDRKHRQALVIEAKWVESESQLEKECEQALQQIEKRRYAEKIEHLGYKKVGRLGIAFYQKKCLVKKDNRKK